MLELYGQCHGSTVLLHGGAGARDPKSPEAMTNATIALKKYGEEAVLALSKGGNPLDALILALKRMEDDPQFNAGLGSALQADGQTRLTAAVMDGARQTFSGVMSCSYVRNPSVIAKYLQTQSSRVLTNPGAELVARELGLSHETNLTANRINDWVKKTAADSCDTVGCVIRTTDGKIFVGTSTGGRGFEYPGRVSDSGTVAGTYASHFAGVSATGVGEEIVDDALAARIETRRRDGLTLEQACRRAFGEAVGLKRQYGWIAVDRDGFWAVTHTTPSMPFAVYDSQTGLVNASLVKS